MSRSFCRCILLSRPPSLRLPASLCPRLEAEKLEGRHYGEASCREYRESMMHVLPHTWSTPHDTWLQPAHFLKHREARGAQRSALAGQDKAKTKGALEEWGGQGQLWS